MKKTIVSEHYKRLQRETKLEKSVQQELDVAYEELKLMTLTGLKSLESPIEQMLAIRLNIYSIDYVKQYQIFDKRASLDLYLQKEIKIGNKNYRADFLIEFDFDNRFYGFVIECDGHDYHERTKEQARRDRKRDRDFLAAGYIVIRFTGSEIYENAANCAMEVYEIIEAQTDYQWHVDKDMKERGLI